MSTENDVVSMISQSLKMLKRMRQKPVSGRTEVAELRAALHKICSEIDEYFHYDLYCGPRGLLEEKFYEAMDAKKTKKKQYNDAYRCAVEKQLDAFNEAFDMLIDNMNVHNGDAMKKDWVFSAFEHVVEAASDLNPELREKLRRVRITVYNNEDYDD